MSIKGSTIGARHLAESAIWLASQNEFAIDVPDHLGVFVESAVSHTNDPHGWLRRFLSWARTLPTINSETAKA